MTSLRHTGESVALPCSSVYSEFDLEVTLFIFLVLFLSAGSKVVCDSLSGQTEVGEVTSGCMSPSLGHNISMGYVRSDLAVAGQKLQVVIRGKLFPYTVTALPFVPNHYVRRPKQV
ncbi:Aminomethyltransferase [Fasciolopsis buskii]|uniref:Aminomethyltransferase n=1 Tax=Fasciolopsis buskii TaxID=27845 RepID=A0A8E0VI89_9TREM|nr:Aminomethyltransferase [Fasciolopsis buski]